MKSLKKSKIVILSTLMIFFGLINVVYAAGKYSVMNWTSKFPDPRNITYRYVSMYNDYSAATTRATYAWNVTNAGVFFLPTNDSDNYNVYIGDSIYGNTGWHATTMPPILGAKASMGINDSYYSVFSSDVIELIAHELGHTLRLNDVSYTDVLMRDKDYRHNPNPTSDDVAGVQEAYK